MKRTIATIATTLALVLAGAGTASAAPRHAPPLPHLNGYPRCVSTTWAAHHYAVPKTPRGTTCFVPMHLDVVGPVVPGEAMAYQFSASWYPQSWSVMGWVLDKGDNPVAMLVRRP